MLGRRLRTLGLTSSISSTMSYGTPATVRTLAQKVLKHWRDAAPSSSVQQAPTCLRQQHVELAGHAARHGVDPKPAGRGPGASGCMVHQPNKPTHAHCPSNHSPLT